MDRIEAQRRSELISKPGTLIQLKDVMLSKLNEASSYHYLHCPSGLCSDELKRSLTNFIEFDLNEFLELAKEVLPTLDETDIDSLGSEGPTLNACRLIAMYHFLESKGIPGVGAFDKPSSFWSGDIARKRALIEDALCDTKVTVIAILFDLSFVLRLAQGGSNDFIRLLGSAISKLYCLHTSKEANVYISSDKIHEPAGLTAPNNFWSAELPMLRKLLWAGKIDDVKIHLYDHEHAMWLAPRSLISKGLDDLPVRRFGAYVPNVAHVLSEVRSDVRFRRLNMTPDELKEWKESSPRPALTFGSLRRIAKLWQDKTLKELDK